jgi:hypothetical protein
VLVLAAGQNKLYSPDFRHPRHHELFCYKSSKIDMSTITEIQEAIEKLPANEKSALAAWFQSQEEPIISEAEETVLLGRLDKASAELDAGKGVPLARVREKIRGWAGK